MVFLSRAVDFKKILGLDSRKTNSIHNPRSNPRPSCMATFATRHALLPLILNPAKSSQAARNILETTDHTDEIRMNSKEIVTNFQEQPTIADVLTTVFGKCIPPDKRKECCGDFRTRRRIGSNQDRIDADANPAARTGAYM